MVKRNLFYPINCENEMCKARGNRKTKAPEGNSISSEELEK